MDFAYHSDVDQPSNQAIESEPIDSGIDPTQSVGSRPDATALTKAQARGPLVGHPLPEALRDIGPAFRSNPVWLLVCQWTSQVMDDYQSTKKELEALRSQLDEKKTENAELKAKLSIASYKSRWQAMGTLFLGLSPAAYLNTLPIYGFVMGGIGILFLYFAWHEKA